MQNITKRISMWAIGVVLFLLIPLGLTIRDGAVEGVGWNWRAGDFIFAFVVLFSAALVYELVAKKMNNKVYKYAVGIAVVSSLLLIWINAAVGIIGDGDLDSPNGMYVGVLAIGVIGATLARCKPQGMSRTLFAMAIAQMTVPIITFMFWRSELELPPGIVGVFILTTFFALLFAGSALLFRRASLKTILF